MASSCNRFLIVVLLSAVCSFAAAELAWWQKATLYQIYPRSFQDTDNNGIGDLNGMVEHVEYLKDLGVTGLWMNPIYDSPLKDFGYDISDYKSIDKTFGTFENFKHLVDRLHKLDMKILIDLVPNHSSNEHPWFKAALAGNKTYIDYYVWQPGKYSLTGNYLPNNWASVMGGSAWEWSAERNMYYYHAFLVEQPDLNYRNKDVVEEMKNVLKFWLDHGVDGFRVDAVPFLVEDDQIRDEPYQANCQPTGSPGCLNHIYTQNLDETYEVLAQFYDVVHNYNNPKYPGEKIMVTEVYEDIRIVQNYFKYKGNQTSTMPFNFQLINVNMETNGTQIKNMVDTWTNNLIAGGWSNWVTGNHDQNRVGHKVGVPMADGMNMLVLLLPGTSFTYYGEELGMDDTYIDCYQMQDTQAIRQANNDCGKMESLSRDPERTPMQWNSSAYGGFSSHKPWLPVNPDYYGNNVEVQKKDPNSHLNIYKNLLGLKKEMIECKNMTTLAPGGWVFAFKRFECSNSTNRYIVLLNFNDDETTVSLSKDFEESGDLFIRAVSKLSDKKIGSKISLDNLTLRPKESIVLATVSSSNLFTPSLTLLLSVILFYIQRFGQ